MNVITQCESERPKPAKSRTGCKNCKAKRLKCDESTGPRGCLNCVKRNIQCPGYVQGFQWKPKHQLKAQDGKRLNGEHSKIPAAASISGHSVGKGADPSGCERQRPTDLEASYHVGSFTYDELPLQDTTAFDADDTAVLDIQAWSGTRPTDTTNVLNGLSEEHHRSRQTAQLQLSSSPLDGMDVLNDFVVSPGDLMCTTNPRPVLDHCESRTALTISHYSADIQDRQTPPSTALVRQLSNPSTKLVEYYFHTISTLYSCYDSPSNPFNYVVGKDWSVSPSVYYAIQSMAAGYLGNELLYMKREGPRLHRLASKYLWLDLQNSTQATIPVLPILLLGLSACWHQADDLGFRYLHTARSLLARQAASRGKEKCAVVSPHRNFLQQALIYWEMLSSFVYESPSLDVPNNLTCSDVDGTSRYDLSESGMGATGDGISLPHPWTGVNPQVQLLVTQVGRLVRQRRTKAGSEDMKNDGIVAAAQLEIALLATGTPSQRPSTALLDRNTKLNDLVRLADIIRDCGLLEIYRVFPEVLAQRWAFDSCVAEGQWVKPDSISWLTKFGVRILQQLSKIPPASHIRVHQLLPLMIAAAELRIPVSERNGLELAELERLVIWGRRFARDRLSQLMAQLPAQPIKVIMKILEEVWDRMDSLLDDEADHVFWVDVMVEKNLHTMMG